MAIRTYDDIEEKVKDAAGNFITCTMGNLRDVQQAGKLGVHVVNAISNELESRGLGHYPPELPSDQWTKVRIFRRSSAVGKVVRALGSFEEKDDELLHSLTGKSSAHDDLERIRAIVCA